MKGEGLNILFNIKIYIIYKIYILYNRSKNNSIILHPSSLFSFLFFRKLKYVFLVKCKI